MRKRLAIIGYGRIGRVAASFLQGKFDIGVYDKKNVQKVGKGVQACSLSDLPSYEVVIFALPVSALESSLVQISKYLNPHALVIDLSSVKEKPARWMMTHLPRTTHILGMHPLFGPDSIGNGFQGKEIIVSPVRISKNILNKAIGSLKSAGMRVTLLTASQHDKLISVTLLLTQFIGRGLAPFHLDESLPRTENYKLLEKVIRSSNNDNFELFLDIYRYNRYAKDIPAKIVKNLGKIEKIIIAEQKKSGKQRKRI